MRLYTYDQLCLEIFASMVSESACEPNAVILKLSTYFTAQPYDM